MTTDDKFLRSIALRISGIDWETDDEYAEVMARVRRIADKSEKTMLIINHEIESWEAELAEAVSDNNFRNAADAQIASDVLNDLKDRLTRDD